MYTPTKRFNPTLITAPVAVLAWVIGAALVPAVGAGRSHIVPPGLPARTDALVVHATPQGVSPQSRAETVVTARSVDIDVEIRELGLFGVSPKNGRVIRLRGLADDGLHPDALADDGVFSASVKLPPATPSESYALFVVGRGWEHGQPVALVSEHFVKIETVQEPLPGLTACQLLARGLAALLGVDPATAATDAVPFLSPSGIAERETLGASAQEWACHSPLLSKPLALVLEVPLPRSGSGARFAHRGDGDQDDDLDDEVGEALRALLRALESVVDAVEAIERDGRIDKNDANQFRAIWHALRTLERSDAWGFLFNLHRQELEEDELSEDTKALIEQVRKLEQETLSVFNVTPEALMKDWVLPLLHKPVLQMVRAFDPHPAYRRGRHPTFSKPMLERIEWTEDAGDWVIDVDLNWGSLQLTLGMYGTGVDLEFWRDSTIRIDHQLGKLTVEEGLVRLDFDDPFGIGLADALGPLFGGIERSDFDFIVDMLLLRTAEGEKAFGIWGNFDNGPFTPARGDRLELERQDENEWFAYQDVERHFEVCADFPSRAVRTTREGDVTTVEHLIRDAHGNWIPVDVDAFPPDDLIPVDGGDLIVEIPLPDPCSPPLLGL